MTKFILLAVASVALAVPAFAGDPVAGEATFKKQPADVQKALLDAGAEATEYSHKWLLETEGKIKKELIAKGMEISDPADGEKEFIAKATTAVWPKFYKSIGGKEKLDRVQKLLGR